MFDKLLTVFINVVQNIHSYTHKHTYPYTPSLTHTHIINICWLHWFAISFEFQEFIKWHWFWSSSSFSCAEEKLCGFVRAFNIQRATTSYFTFFFFSIFFKKIFSGFFHFLSTNSWNDFVFFFLSLFFEHNPFLILFFLHTTTLWVSFISCRNIAWYSYEIQQAAAWKWCAKAFYLFIAKQKIMPVYARVSH